MCNVTSDSTQELASGHILLVCTFNSLEETGLCYGFSYWKSLGVERKMVKRYFVQGWADSWGKSDLLFHLWAFCSQFLQWGRNWIWGWLGSSYTLYSHPSQKEYGLICKFGAGMTVEKNQLSHFCERMKLVMNVSGGKSGMLCAVQRLRNALKISLSCLSQETKRLSWVKLKEIRMYDAL